MKKHISWDVETFAKRDFGMVISLGACMFNPLIQGGIEERFYVTISPELSEAAGFVMDADTVTWWMLPEQRPAYDAWRAIAHFSPSDACQGFRDWLRALDLAYEGEDRVKEWDQIMADGGPDEAAARRRMWGNDPDFDNRLIRQMYAKCGIDRPWEHTGNRDHRTLKNLAGASAVKPEVTNLRHHNAIDDAIYQALWMQNIVKLYEGMDLG